LIVAGIFGYLNFDLIQIRINGWLNPWLDPSGGSYQIIQSIQAIAAGHILGLGPGLGSPGVVPVAISDFIFAAISEELGLIGGLFIICLYSFLAYRGFLISIRTRNQFQKLLAFGITIFIAIQAILIIGGNTRLLPLTGVTLPFVSYGGSSLVTVFISALFLLLISQNQSSKSIEINEIKPFFISYSGILIGFSLLTILSSYWSVIRSDSLLARPDNLRMIINDRYVPRGDLLDRQNNPILITTGTRGSYSRWLEDPSLSTTVGYNHPFLGQSGLEASMDSYLRGLAGMPSSDIFWNEMIYARPPDGLDIRTTIDLQRQNQITQILSAQQGAAVIMNAKTGEILAMWSSPSFDSNQIEEEWSDLLNHEDAPLLNRVTQGNYEIGNLSSLFYYGYASEYLIKIDETNFYEGGNCASPLSSNQKSTIQVAIMNGCTDANEYLAQLFDQNINIELIQKFGWSEVFEFELPIQAVPIPIEESNQSLNALQISPLQLARASAAFSNAGYIPYPRLAQAVNTPKQGWIAFQSKEPLKVTEASSANQTANYFSRSDFPTWEISSTNFSTDNPTHWYVSGTLPNWQASPLVLVLTLETGTSEDAKLLGREIMENVLSTNN
jgi:glycopeptide antibiotics resistance protein